jgi:APA family basic amino acid/polyamine antiporter
MALALVVGNIVGSGVYLLPAQLAPYGWSAGWAWAITIGGALCLSLVIAHLARALPEAGGAIGFLRAAFGPLAAFVVGWAYLVALWVGIVAIATAAVSYLSSFHPAIVAGTGAPALLALGLIWTLTAINLAGVRAAGGFQLLTVVLKLLPLLAVAAIGALLVATGTPPANPYDADAVAPAGIATAATLTLWAMLGFESAALGEARIANPARVVPLATVLGALVAGLAYLAVCLVMIAYLPKGALAQSSAPFADFIAVFWGRGPAMLVALFAAVSAIGAVNGYILLLGEIPRGMAASGDLPRWLAATDARGTPYASLLVSGAIVSGLTLANYDRTMAGLFAFLALVSTAANLVLYFACAAALVRLAAMRTIRASALMLAITALGIAYSLWTFHGAGLEASAWTLLLCAAGLPIYAVARAQKSVVLDRDRFRLNRSDP